MAGFCVRFEREDTVEFTARQTVELRHAYIKRIALAMIGRNPGMGVSTATDEERKEAAMMLGEWTQAGVALESEGPDEL